MMDKEAYKIKFMHQAKGSNDILDSLVTLFKNIKPEVMTRAEIVDTIKQYKVILNEEFKKSKP